MSMYVLETPAPQADFRLPYGDGPQHFGDLRLPAGDGPHPVIIMIHGGFWRARYSLEHLGHACAALTGRGVATWSIEYRRIGDEGGGWPGTFKDVGRAADYLRELAPTYNLDLKRVIVMGHSAGGHLACWTAARQRIPAGDPLYSPDPLPVRAAVSLAGVINLREAAELQLSNGVTQELMGGSPDQYPERYATASPAELLPLGVPQLLIHGTNDQNVPFQISQHYLEKAQALGDAVKLITLPGAGHFEVIDPLSAEWAAFIGVVLKSLDQENNLENLPELH